MLGKQKSRSKRLFIGKKELDQCLTNFPDLIFLLLLMISYK